MDRTARSLPALARRLLRPVGPRLAWGLALGWVAALLGLVALYRQVGEASWAVVLLLYLPRFPWALPGLALLPTALGRGRRALLLPLAAGLLVWLFPVMGFVLPGGAAPAAGPTLRVLTWNVTGHRMDTAGVREVLAEAHADLVLLQWSSHFTDEALAAPEFAGWYVERASQFTIASRFPLSKIVAAGIPSGTGEPCAHTVVESPLGPLDVFTIRPQSARQELGAAHKRTLRQRIVGVLEGALAGGFENRTGFREAQTRSIAEAMAAATHPLLVGGDSNVPDGSRWLDRYFGDLQDAFAETGWGFGYTHPALLPWMRLDRIFLGKELAPVSVEVLGRRPSAHRPVVAVVARRAGR